MGNCTILHTEASTGWGGQEIRILTESIGMMKRGYHVLVACQPGSVISGRAKEVGIETRVLRMGGAFDIRGILQLRNLILREGIGIVNTHSSKDGWTAGIAARLCGGVKLIRSRHIGARIQRGFGARLSYKILPHEVIAVGEEIREHVIEMSGVSPDAIISLPTGIDMERFQPSRADDSKFRKDVGIPEGTPLVGTVGMLRGEKGHKYFVDAAALVAKKRSDVYFAIVGDTAFKSNIKETLGERIKGYGLQDKFIMTGYRNDVPDVMSALDVFVLPSLVEPFGQVATQALAMERPVVGTNVGGIPEQVVEGKTGLLVEKANPEEMAKAILYMLDNPEKASEFGRNGRKWVEDRWSLERMLDRTEELYSQLFSNNSRRKQ